MNKIEITNFKYKLKSKYLIEIVRINKKIKATAVE